MNCQHIVSIEHEQPPGCSSVYLLSSLAKGFIKNTIICVYLVFMACSLCRAQSLPNIPKDTSFNTRTVHAQIRKNFPFAVPVRDSLPNNLIRHVNQVYAQVQSASGGKRELHLDIFRPKKFAKLPALVMIHGGGWRSGDRSMEIPMAQLIASRGYVTVTVEYQLSLEARYPAAVHNIKAAIRWLKANANDYNIDTNQIAISGTSAGGQLAALVGTTPGVAKLEGKIGDFSTTSTVHAIVDIDGVINFLAPSSLNLIRKPNSPDVEWLGGTYLQRPDVWKEASAGYWANENTCPMLFINSGFSRFHAGQDELVGSLKEWGIYHEVRQINVKVHPFWLFHPWADQAVDYIVDFLQKVFRK